ncbi:T9SS type A sorting domain-containing protein [Fulvivirga sp.]|uniref:T9SS type A sorting domain-containing protein n=1 Tax=Fulvivirga sp. TaxID=1931237 RepID=UPI0032EBC8D2
MIKKFIFLIALSIICSLAQAQHSIARKWNEALLDAIRKDFARPTVHARNLFHTSAATYDAWAAFEENTNTYFLGNSVHGFNIPFNGIAIPEDKQAAQEEAISYACYRLLSHRFKNSPSAGETLVSLDDLFFSLGYSSFFTSTDYSTGSPAALGNYIAEQIIAYGNIDGSNEENGYQNKYYEPINEPLYPVFSGNESLSDPNRWQPLGFDIFIDQSGQIIPGAVPSFLSPEWGKVLSFALKGRDLTIHERDDDTYHVYHDPGTPPSLEADGGGLSDEYKWNFGLVAKWSSHLDPTDDVMWDISPGAAGNLGGIENIPTELFDYRNFYNELEGGDPGQGRDLNPKTGLPYESNIVPRGDYTRVLAEFWADGPDSETPPGHWFTILHYVNDQPDLIRKFNGQGEVLSQLEWDVKCYFVLGGAMHDVAITAWGIKGWYDYIRPISAIRFMADNGQSSDPNGDNYSPQGIPLEPGFVEVVAPDDPLVNANPANIGKIKVKAWKGPNYINDPLVDEAGVGWILAENWWPYQRPSFVTPPFAGYISGHSTFSRAAAKVLTLLTGDEYFPGGMGTFEAPKNEFLVFEEGPSVDVTLQWATYNDASDQTSLSRIWGGIHPPADDLRGRIIGEQIGDDAFEFALRYFSGQVTARENKINPYEVAAIPNPSNEKVQIRGSFGIQKEVEISVYSIQGLLIDHSNLSQVDGHFEYNTSQLPNGSYIINIQGKAFKQSVKLIVSH